jgi:alkaline phosphatase
MITAKSGLYLLKQIEIMRKSRILIVFIMLLLESNIQAQYTTLNAHSHNDYVNDPAFWLAYNNHFGSVEADIWAINGELYVGHNSSDIKPERTLDILYLQPIVNLFGQNKGKPWADSNATFQLLIDLKTVTEPTLSLLVEKLKKYPDVFDPEINSHAIRIIITGNRPDPSAFEKYPLFIFFDGLLHLKYNPNQLKRVPLFSENIKQFSQWNGEGLIIEKERIRLEKITDSVHALYKKIRFWNCPDNENAWRTYMKLHIDYLNTDQIVKLTEYLK